MLFNLWIIFVTPITSIPLIRTLDNFGPELPITHVIEHDFKPLSDPIPTDSNLSMDDIATM